jgi:hypothetical protein
LIGEVRKLVTVQPERVKLKGSIGEKISQTVIIAPGTEETFNIVKVSPMKGTDIRYAIQQIELSGKKAYQLTVENIKETEGRYMDKITIITDRNELPPLAITVSGEIKQASIESSMIKDNPPTPPDALEKKL